MTARATTGYAALTEREKQTLRMIVRGHDAKSIARQLDLSVHTINERLRDARRKLAVSSSREAARLVLARETAAPDSVGDRIFGEADAAGDAAQPGSGRRMPRPALFIGGFAMTMFLGLLALAVQYPPPAPAPAPAPSATNAAAVTTARDFLALVDAGRWDDSYRAFGQAFRKLNSLAVWTDVSNRVRPPLGAVASRTFLSQQNLPAPPDGYEVVKFRTDFANKPGATETVTLEREAGGWRVVAIIIE